MTATHSKKPAVPSTVAAEIYDEVAYSYDGTLEGLLSAIFAAYERHEYPSDVTPDRFLQPRLGQRVSYIDTDFSHADRVAAGIRRLCGSYSFEAVKRAALSDDPAAGTAAYRFVRFAIDEQNRRDCATCRKSSTCSGARNKGPCPRRRAAAFSDITHPAVEPLFKITRAVNNECEHMRQFIRFEHLRDEEGHDVWFARCNPNASVVPLIMGHFVERFSVQPFIIYDEVHHLAGVYDGDEWYLVNTGNAENLTVPLPDPVAQEALYSEAWRTFYRCVSIDARYNPELRRHFMPKRFWKNITEMQENTGSSKFPYNPRLE